MKVVFFEEVEGTAQVGEVREVKNGFARNYLLPRGIAGPPTKNNLMRAERLAKADAIRQEKLDAVAGPIGAAIDGQELVFEARVGQQGRLFGSVTARDIAERLTEIAEKAVAGARVEHRQVQLPQSLRELGTATVPVRLTRNVHAQVSVEVKADEESLEMGISEYVSELEEAEAVEAVEEGETAAEGAAEPEAAETAGAAAE